jgi:hypothetical protein
MPSRPVIKAGFGVYIVGPQCVHGSWISGPTGGTTSSAAGGRRRGLESIGMMPGRAAAAAGDAGDRGQAAWSVRHHWLEHAQVRNMNS